MTKEFNDIIKDEPKIKFSEFRDFIYEIEKVWRAHLAERDEKIMVLEKQVNVLSNQLDSSKKFYNNELIGVLRQFNELKRDIKSGFEILEKQNDNI